MMSNENTLLSKTSSLSEILVTNVNEDEKTIFNEYIDKKEIGRSIFKELYKRFRKDGFVLQDNSNEVGILSQCHSLQTLMSLAQDFGLDFTTTDYFPGQKLTIRQVMDDVIEDVVNRVVVKNEQGEATGYKFDASPYDSDHFDEEYSNIDTITWVVTTFFLVLKYHAHVKEVCKWEPTLIAIIKQGLRYINQAFIVESKASKTEDKGLATGWNFTKECKEPSLYFTFAVCECYLDMFSTFEPFLEYLHAEKNERVYGLAVDPDLKAAFFKKKDEYDQNRNRKVGKLQAKYDEYNELARIFRLINDIDDFEDLRIDNTLYGTFEANCKTVARRVWDFVRADLADKFFYNNLKDTVSENELRMSTTSDVLFNTVYIVNILVGAGMDEVLKNEQLAAQRRGNMEEAHKKEREYDNMLESCLLAVQKAFRTYESLKSIGKDYIVDQFLIGFNEDFDGHHIAVNELRKLRMRCFSLLPMLIHANNVVSEYLVKYPQYNMRKYLEYILDNRLADKKQATRWIWERDGFFSGSNYYYVLALHEFFDYYEAYEKSYIEIGKNNKRREKEIQDKYLVDLQQPNELIGQKETELALKEEALREKQEKIDALTAELKNVQRPVEDAVRQIIEEEMKKHFASMLSDTFAHGARVFALSSVDDTDDTADHLYGSIHKNLLEMIMASAVSDYADVQRIKTAEKYDDVKKKISKDFKKAVFAYFDSVANTTDKSTLVRLFDEKKK